MAKQTANFLGGVAVVDMEIRCDTSSNEHRIGFTFTNRAPIELFGFKLFEFVRSKAKCLPKVVFSSGVFQTIFIICYPCSPSSPSLVGLLVIFLGDHKSLAILSIVGFVISVLAAATARINISRPAWSIHHPEL